MAAPIISNPVRVTVAPAPDLGLLAEAISAVDRLERYVTREGPASDTFKVRYVLKRIEEVLRSVAPGSTPDRPAPCEPVFR